jgi:carboxymethylenebutenolidase
MCAPFDSKPPLAPIAGAAVRHASEVLESSDGARFAAFAAHPDAGSASCGVVILPDIRGLFAFYEELALRFAEVGHPAVAIDYFGRTAGVSARDGDVPSMDHVPLTRPEQIQLDVAAAVAFLRSPAGGSSGEVATVGFCFGGRHSWLSAAGGHGLTAAVGFYGQPAERNGQPGPTALAGSLEAPILALMGGADEHITADQVSEFERALEAAAVPHQVITYAGAPHGFFDRRFAEFAADSADAWRRTLAFIAEPA